MSVSKHGGACLKAGLAMPPSVFGERCHVFIRWHFRKGTIMNNLFLNLRNLVTGMNIIALVLTSLIMTGCQSPSADQPDEAFLESVRTEQHPDRDNPYIPDNVKFIPYMIYGSVNGRNLTADVFTPQQMPAKPRPAIVFLHGGSWMFGGPSQFHFHSAYLAAKYNFFAMSVDYRMSGEAKFPAALQDAKCAIRWIRAHAKKLNIDPERIAICGGSAGGHLSSMIATTAGVPEYEGNGGNPGYPSHANLAILFNGEFDMWDLVKKGSLIGAMKQFIGGTHEEMPEKYDELSSIKRINKNTPPTLLLHGTKDYCVSHKQSIAFHDRLKELGIHTEIELYKDKPHAWFNKEPDRTITLKRMEKFLAEQFNLKITYQGDPDKLLNSQWQEWRPNKKGKGANAKR